MKSYEEKKTFEEMSFFANMPWFEGWNFNLLKGIYLNSLKKTFVFNDIIFKEGDSSNDLYLIKKGNFLVWIFNNNFLNNIILILSFTQKITKYVDIPMNSTSNDEDLDESTSCLKMKKKRKKIEVLSFIYKKKKNLNYSWLY